jgi:hypothetical protein
MLHGRVGHGGFEEGAGHESLQDPTPPALARFHPVPTRPVFEPQAVAYAPEMEMPAVPRPEQLPRPQGGSSRRSLPQNRAAQKAAQEFGVVTEDAVETQVAENAYPEPTMMIRQASYEAPSDESGATKSNRFTAAPQKNAVTWKVARRRA